METKNSVMITPPLQNFLGQRHVVHLYWIDLIRFVAAFLVVLCHFRGAFLPEYSNLPVEQHTPLVFLGYALTRLGQEAVLIFFVMSGYLVAGRAIEKIHEGVFDLKNYCIDRSVRIMLPLVSALMLYIPKELICGNSILWKDWFGCLFSLQGIWTGACIEPLWSLSYEVWFYIILGSSFAALYSGKTKNKIIGFVVLVMCLLVFTKLLAHYLFIWLLGGLTYVSMPKKKNPWLLVGSTISLFVMITILQLTSGGHVTSSFVKYLPTQNRYSLELIYGLVFCVFLQQVVLIQPKHLISLVANNIGTKLAAFSYTLYLVHVLIMRILEHFGAVRAVALTMDSILLYLLYTSIALLACYGVYWCCERHTFTVKCWIKNRV